MFSGIERKSVSFVTKKKRKEKMFFDTTGILQDIYFIIPGGHGILLGQWNSTNQGVCSLYMIALNCLF